MYGQSGAPTEGASTDPEQQKLRDDELQKALASAIEDAADFIDLDLGEQRALATRYYKGEPFGDEEQGRSQIVTPVVRDVVSATMPSLMRQFFGTQRIVEFAPGSKTSGDMANDVTNTVNYILTVQNPGFSIFLDVFKDALVRGSGWVKWYWDDSKRVTAKVYTGVTEEQLESAHAELDEYETLDVINKRQVGTKQVQTGERPVMTGFDPMTGQPSVQMQPVMSEVPVFEYSIRIVRKAPVNQVRVCAVPPEEIIVSRDAIDEHGARLIGHRCLKTRGELVAMGIDEATLDAAASQSDERLATNVELLARQISSTDPRTELANETDDQEKIAYYECFYRIDYDGDGISELRKVCAVGGKKLVTHNDYVDEVSLALFCPDPEPHVVFGLSQADRVMDLQLIESHVTRDVLDSLKASIFPRMAYVEGQANVDDVLNTEIGAAIRMRAPGMVAPMEVPFTGANALPLLDRFGKMRESRTGLGDASMALEGKALQSTTPDAARSAMTASQAQVEMIARIFAETGMKPIFRGVLKLLVQYQDHAMQFHLNGRDFDVNPTKWDSDMQVVVDTALGQGTNDQKLGVLASVAERQEKALMMMGLDNPLCSLQEYYHVQTRMLELVGIRDTHRIWRNPEISMQQGKQVQPPKPTPEETIAEAEMKIKSAQLDKERLALILEDDRERDKFEAEIFLKAKELELKYNTTIDVAQIRALMDRERISAQAARATSAA